MEARLPLQPINLMGNVAENWKQWLQKFEIYSTAVELDAKQEKIQCAQLLHHMGEQAINIFNSFIFNEEENNKIAILKSKFTNYFTPKKNLTYERYKFFTARQGMEKMDQFITQIKNQANQCELGELKEHLIKAMVIIGIKDDALRAKLLEKEECTLDKVIECCMQTEASRQQLKAMQDKEGSNYVKEQGEMVDAVNKTKRDGYTNHRFQHPVTSKWRSTAIKNGSIGRQVRYTSGNVNKTIKDCTKCGRNHFINQCPAYGKMCNLCKMQNHFANMCRNKKRVNEIQNDSNEQKNLIVGNINVNNHKYCTINLILNKNKKSYITFKIDTGASVNLISLEDFDYCKLNRNKIQRSDEVLSTYTGESIPIVGKCYLEIMWGSKQLRNVEFYVTRVKKSSILGLNSCVKFEIVTLHRDVNIQSTCNVVSVLNQNYDKLINQYQDIFKGIGKIGKPYHIELKQNIKPVINPVRKVPFALQNQFKQLLQDLVNKEIIERVNSSTDWVNSFVLVKKSDDSLRVCLDPKNLNEVIKDSKYKLPNIDEISSKLSGATIFSKLDATSGFWNIPLDDESANLCTFGTPFGRFRFCRMPFGIKIASEVFQEYFSDIFQNEGIEIYIDDILIYGKTKEEHDQRLKKVFEIALKNNVKFNIKKCQFGLSEVKYLGFKFSKKGITIDEDKSEAIRDMPTPKNKNDVQKFLGMITYVGRFVNNLSELTKPLRDLLRNNIHFEWGSPQTDAFNKLKDLITAEQTLKYFEPNEPVTISVDASSYGLGAVLMQNNKPCAYASRAMTDTQIYYAQIEKELLAICFGCNKFYQYVFGTKFTVETDHKPLLSIFKKPLSECPARLQRMMLSLQKFNIELIYKPGKNLIIADTLSRMNVDKIANELNYDNQVCVVDTNIQISDERIKQLVNATENDVDLKTIKKYVQNGWPKHLNKTPTELKSFYKLKSVITLANDGLLYKDNKIIIPKLWRNKILCDIHTGHLGISKCIQRASCAVFWPGINTDIEYLVRKCEICNKYSNSNRKEQMIPHEIIKKPWQKVGIDIYELYNQNYLIAVDYYSKYPEILNLNNNLTSENVINKLKSIFARHGTPKLVMSDSGRQFTSEKFQKFANEWNFQTRNSSPHYQQSNGLAERTIQTIKKLIKKCYDNNDDIYAALLAFRNTPILNTTYSPSQLLMSRYLRDNLIISDRKLKPKLINNRDVSNTLTNHQVNASKYYNKKCISTRQEFQKNDLVWYQEKPKSVWKKGKITNYLRDRTYTINDENGRCIIRNKFYIRSRNEQPTCSSFSGTSKYVASNVLDDNVTTCVSTAEQQRNSNHGQNVQVDVRNRKQNNYKRNVNLPVKYSDYEMF